MVLGIGVPSHEAAVSRNEMQPDVEAACLGKHCSAVNSVRPSGDTAPDKPNAIHLQSNEDSIAGGCTFFARPNPQDRIANGIGKGVYWRCLRDNHYPQDSHAKRDVHGNGLKPDDKNWHTPSNQRKEKNEGA